MTGRDLQPVRRQGQPRGLLETARRAAAKDTADGLLMLHARKRTPQRIIDWIFGD